MVTTLNGVPNSTRADWLKVKDSNEPCKQIGKIPENKIPCQNVLFWPRPLKIQMQIFEVTCKFSQKVIIFAKLITGAKCLMIDSLTRPLIGGISRPTNILACLYKAQPDHITLSISSSINFTEHDSIAKAVFCM